MNSKGIFITGTDTGCGKTIVAGLLARFLKEKGYRTVTQKWIETGCRKPNDADSLCRPYVFKFAASPHLAAREENRHIQEAKIKKSFKILSASFDFVIVEGVGGSLVPFNKKRLVIDIAKDLNLPTLIVSANKLGAINHSLLTIEAVMKRKMKLIGLVFNNLRPRENKTILKDNPQIVSVISQEKILGIFPYSKSKNFLYKKFIPVGKNINQCF